MTVHFIFASFISILIDNFWLDHAFQRVFFQPAWMSIITDFAAVQAWMVTGPAPLFQAYLCNSGPAPSPPSPSRPVPRRLLAATLPWVGGAAPRQLSPLRGAASSPARAAP